MLTGLLVLGVLGLGVVVITSLTNSLGLLGLALGLTSPPKPDADQGPVVGSFDVPVGVDGMVEGVVELC